jgi:predicted MPP superfamily phosphohydrolase
MTPERLWIAISLFHFAALAGLLAFDSRWRRPGLCTRSSGRWFGALVRDLLVLAVLIYLGSLIATLIANRTWPGRIRLGQISLRLLGQAIFFEGPLLALVLAWRHRTAREEGRARVLLAAALSLAAVHVDAYYIEPQMLVPRHYIVEPRSGAPSGRSIRILHITDIQTPAIGPHEERALRLGLSYGPDLIVMTGDYVQDALGQPTELNAAADLRALISRIGFDAPLGVFATEGDVGPSCGVVFKGTKVRCLADGSAGVDLQGGGTLAITGLTRGRGRERDPKVLGRILAGAPEADYHIVISHAPDFISAMPMNVDLALAGHTHGGQVVLPFFGPPATASRLPRRYAGGLNDYRGTPLHVSRGVGMERGFDIPVRFLCPPEIGILDLQLPQRIRSAADSATLEQRAVTKRFWE